MYSSLPATTFFWIWLLQLSWIVPVLMLTEHFFTANLCVCFNTRSCEYTNHWLFCKLYDTWHFSQRDFAMPVARGNGTSMGLNLLFYESVIQGLWWDDLCSLHKLFWSTPDIRMTWRSFFEKDLSQVPIFRDSDLMDEGIGISPKTSPSDSNI